MAVIWGTGDKAYVRTVASEVREVHSFGTSGGIEWMDGV